MITPTERDILSGKGKNVCNRDGNQRLLALAKMNMVDYISTTSKREKALIVDQIISTMKTEGRNFFKMDKATNDWKIADEKSIRTKITQCIRDRKAKKSRCSSPATLVSESSLDADDESLFFPELNELDVLIANDIDTVHVTTLNQMEHFVSQSRDWDSIPFNPSIFDNEHV
ncbi:hypothetical protein CTEN210_07671 [Chaetoceros tenuissimus]|uniref:DUF6824 domain-containing protein n=1 Tax=Chaetoceros tenuissimus TaxID=426638 RepID=A0AAD3CUK7_9STRA|nr:hypothetical protein CTEN210_07671 [Chaetoceros tenuissimus]